MASETEETKDDWGVRYGLDGCKTQETAYSHLAQKIQSLLAQPKHAAGVLVTSITVTETDDGWMGTFRVQEAAAPVDAPSG